MADITPSFQLKIDGGGDADTPALQLAVDANKYLTLDGKSLIDLIYPVGITINSAVQEMSPSTLFPGTEWARKLIHVDRVMLTLVPSETFNAPTFDAVRVYAKSFENLLIERGLGFLGQFLTNVRAIGFLLENGGGAAGVVKGDYFVKKNVSGWTTYSIGDPSSPTDILEFLFDSSTGYPNHYAPEPIHVSEYWFYLNQSMVTYTRTK